MNHNELYHHGILGMKWGVRRFQNKDGTRTALGKARDSKNAKKLKALSQKAKIDKQDYDDILENGLKSKALSKHYPGVDKLSDKKFEETYGIPKKEALESTTRVLKNKVTRDEYRRKMLSGEELNMEEAKLLREDRIKKALIIAGVTGVGVYAAYKMGAFDKKEDEKLGKVASGILEQSLSEGEVEHVIKQGFEFHRMSGWEHEDFSKRTGLYVTATDADRDIYKAYLRDWHGTGKRFEATLQATKDIKVAGSKKQRELLSELLEDNDYFDAFALKFAGTPIFSAVDREETRKYIKGGKGAIRDSYYKKSIYDLVKQDSTLGKRYMEYAMSKGYDAFVDDFDRGDMSYMPLILFNPTDVVKQVGSTRVTAIDQQQAATRTKARGIVVGFSGIYLPDKGH